MPPVDERAVLAARLRILLDRFAAQIDEFPPGTLDARVLGGGNSANTIVAHVVGAVRAWVLGIGCGRDATRDRAAEFASHGVAAPVLTAGLRALAAEIDGALATLAPARLDEVVVPAQSLAGLAPAVEIARRAAIVSALAHAAEHLGELMLIKDLLLERRAGA